MRDLAKATDYLQTATSYGLLPVDANRRVQLVQVDITDAGSIAPAIGNASKVRTPLNILADVHCARLALQEYFVDRLERCSSGRGQSSD